jgi:tetratricopeptide (TPR) repeat protein
LVFIVYPMITRKWLFPLLFVGLLLLQGPSLLQSWSTNRQASIALRICLSQTEAANTERDSINKPWLQTVIAHCTGDALAARTASREAMEASPHYVPLVRGLAPDDLALATFAASLYPNDPQALFWLGDLLVEQEDADNAIIAYEQGLVADSQNGLIWVRLGRLYEDKGDWETAVQAYDQGCHYVDQGKNGCPAAGRLYLEHQMYEQAADRFQQSLQQLPGYPASLRGLAEALLALGRNTDVQPYLKALAARGDNWAQEQLDKTNSAGQR